MAQIAECVHVRGSRTAEDADADEPMHSMHSVQHQLLRLSPRLCSCLDKVPKVKNLFKTLCIQVNGALVQILWPGSVFGLGHTNTHTQRSVLISYTSELFLVQLFRVWLNRNHLLHA